EVVYGSEGTGSSIAGFNYSLKAFAKTGTSSEVNDLWMVAGSPYYVGSVYYGFDEKTRITTGSTSAARIWKAVMTKVHRGLKTKTFEQSDDVYHRGIGYYKRNVKVSRILYADSSSDEPLEDTSKNSSSENSSKNASSSGTTASSQTGSDSSGTDSQNSSTASSAVESPGETSSSSSDPSGESGETPSVSSGGEATGEPVE
ncbi:MAG: hypothetical protein IJT66_02840, partial [Clostridia bacterium]|nr:hypothetical protein [Clostridia bacterium]